MAFVELCWDAEGSSRVVWGPGLPAHVTSGKSDLLSSCEGHLGIPLALLKG